MAKEFLSDVEIYGGLSVAGQYVSSIMGQPAFLLSDTILNPNLNADLLDGYHGSYYLDFTNATNKHLVSDQLLTGWSIGSNVAITASDTIKQAFGKTQAQINSLATSSHAALTLGTTNGLSLASGQILSLQAATTSLTGALTSTDWNTFNNKIGGSGTSGTYPVFTGTRVVGNGLISQSSGNVNINASYTAFGAAGDYSQGIYTDFASGAHVFRTSSAELYRFNYNATEFRISADGGTTAHLLLDRTTGSISFATGIRANGAAGSSGQFFKSNGGSANSWVNIGQADVTNLVTDLAAKQAALSGTGLVKSTSGTITYLTDNTANWDAAYGWGDYKLRSITVAGTSGRITSSAGTQTFAADRAWTLDLATVGTAGTYKSVTTDAYGRVTAGTNPTTLAGYGITDAAALVHTHTASDITDFTTAGRGLISGTGAISYNSTTGVISYTGGAGTGTVTSVALSAPTGFSVSGSPVTSSGTLALAFAVGYSLPSDTTQATWTAKQAALSGTGIVKSTGGTISYLTDNSSNWDAAYTATTGLSTTYVRKATADTISADHSFTSFLIKMSGHSYHNLYTGNTDVYKHFYPTASGNGVTNTFANFRVWDGSGGTYKTLRFGGDGTLTWNGGNVALQSWVSALGYTTNTGTVTSVALSAPTGFSVSGSPVTSSGTLALSFAAGYSLPSDATQAAWTAKATASGTTGTLPIFTGTSAFGNSLLSQSGVNLNVRAQFTSFGQSGQYQYGFYTDSGSGAVVFYNATPSELYRFNYNSTDFRISADGGTTAHILLDRSTGSVSFATGIRANGSAGTSGQYLKSAGGGANTWGGVTSGDVTGALGFTPYNSSNPSGYITNSALSGYATESWVNAQGFKTSISSGDVTGALGYTPYNSSNPSGYITGINSGNVTGALGYTPLRDDRTVTINGYTQYLSGNPSWSVVDGSGSSGYYSKWSGGSTIGNGNIYDNGSEITFNSGRDFGVEGHAAFRKELHVHEYLEVGKSGYQGTLLLHSGSGGGIDSSLIFEARSTSKGSLPWPKMTYSDRITVSSPTIGLVVFQTDTTPGGGGVGPKVYFGAGVWFGLSITTA